MDDAAQHLSVLYPLTPPPFLGKPQFWIRVHQGQNSSPEEENSGPEDGRVKGGGTAVVMNSHATSVPQLEKERLDFGPIRYSILLSWTVSLRQRSEMQDEIPCPASILRILSLSHP